MANIVPWQGVIQSNLRHKSLSWLLSLLVRPLAEDTMLSKALRKHKLEVQATELSTWRRLRARMKQGTLKPMPLYLKVNPAKHLRCYSWESGIPTCRHEHLYLESCCIALHEPVLQLHFSHLRLAESSLSYPSTSLVFTALRPVRQQRQCTSGYGKDFVNWRVLGLFPLSYSWHYL